MRSEVVEHGQELFLGLDDLLVAGVAFGGTGNRLTSSLCLSWDKPGLVVCSWSEVLESVYHEGQMNCPQCGVTFEHFIEKNWGDGVHSLPMAPLFCTACGELMLYEFATEELHRLTAEQKKALRRNLALNRAWEELTHQWMGPERN